MAAAEHPAWYANGRLFSTPDSDNDAAPGHCAVLNACGWWFGFCSANNVNLEPDGIWTTGSPVYDVQASHMLVKLN